MLKLILLTAAITLTNCCHTRYTEAHDPPTLLFHIGDKVKSTASCTPNANFINVCHTVGLVIEVQNFKSICYPQSLYVIEYKSSGGLKLIENYCPYQLQLQGPTRSTREVRERRDYR